MKYHHHPINDAVASSNPTPTLSRMVKLFSLAAGICLLSSCEKADLKTENDGKIHLNAAGRETYLPSTEKELVVNLTKTTEVLKKLYIDTKTLPLSMPQ